MSIFVAEIDDQFHGAIGQNAFESMIGVDSLMKPEQFDKLVQRRTRDVRGDDHFFFNEVNFVQYRSFPGAQNETR